MKMEGLSGAVREAAARGLTLAAHRVQARAVPLTPKEVGDLRSSLTVTEASAGNLVSGVSSDLPYAVRQHEDLSFRHKSGQAKFLEIASLQSQEEIEQIVATQVRRALG